MKDKRKTILYIEDDPEARIMMAEILLSKGYRFLESDRGLKGIEQAEEHLPDLILMDLNLPDMQGYEVTTHLKNNPRLKNTPIIAITGMDDDNAKEITLTAGCDGYITKPIDLDNFTARIAEYLAGKQDKLTGKDEKKYLQKYNVQLVGKLKRKIDELQNLNKDLTGLNRALAESSDQLVNYNDHLFFLNDLANRLRRERDPDELIHILPTEVIRGFPVKRFAFFEISDDQPNYTVISAAGFEDKSTKRLSIPADDTLLTFLRREGAMVRINDVSHAGHPALRKFGSTLDSHSFILGDMSSLGAQHDSNQMMNHITMDAPDIQFKPEKRLLFYMDKYPGPEVFQTYDMRILKSLMQSVSIIYENMVLYDRLVALYKIREQQAIRDELTKVYNYRYFIQELEREADRTQRFERPFSLLMIDLDNFKKFNDEFGHLEGNEALRILSSLFVENTRATDTVARYGGEEFVIILPGLSKEAATKLAEKLRAIVEKSHVMKTEKRSKFKLTISIGLACFPADTNKVDQLVLLADEAMYRAKQDGKNCVRSV